jgi:glycosyltransferase involved in cell wall biosynthesis
MNSPFFSVIIPTLNEEKYLPTLLASLSKQTYKNFEVIVVDGKSKDKTDKVFDKYKNQLPSAQFIVSDKANAGYQRNLGALRARGEYLVFIDADCDVAPTFLEELHIAAVKQKFLFATTWIKPDSDKPIDELMMLLGNLVQEFAKGMKRQYSGGYNTIVRKDIFEKLRGFRQDLVINEDCDFALRAQKERIEVVILKEPQVIFSLRRFRREGTLQLFRKYVHAQIYNILQGPMTKDIVGYPMGGQAHLIKKRKKINLAKWNTYLRAIRKLERKMLSLLEE